jgi:hypothetical protein
MILGIHRLLNVWLVKALAIDNQVVLILLDPNALVFIEQLVLLMDLKTVFTLVQ